MKIEVGPGLQKIWQETNVDPVCADYISRSLNIPFPIAAALVARGITTPSDADCFLNPRLSSLSDPFCLPGMREAVDRIWDALDQGQKIVVFADYDTDGLTSAALMVSVLRQLGGDVAAFVPNRFEHGYGLSQGAVTKCLETLNPDLIITVDCGTNSPDGIALARRAGVDVVVTDHHEGLCSGVNAVSVINPAICGCETLRHLAGVGVAFKVCHAIVKDGLARGGSYVVGGLDLRNYLDLVAAGTVADVAILRGENRTLVRHGLVRLNEVKSEERRVGLRALMEVAGLSKRIDTYHLSFLIGPRLNAAGRMGSAEEALNLLLADDEAVARDLASRLESANSRRKEIEEEILAASIRQVEEFFDEQRHFGLVVAGAGWHIGTLGIVAGRLCTVYRRPVIVVSKGQNGICRGSARSIEILDLIEVLKGCADLLDTFGGHPMAAALTLKQEKLDDFRARFNDICTGKLAGKNLAAAHTIDAWISLNEATLDFYEYVEKMRPFGVGNPMPIWGTRKVQVIGRPRLLKDSHLKMTVGVGGSVMEGVAFGMAERSVPEGDLDILYRLRLNEYAGRRRLELEIQDFRPHNSANS